jgi:GT2 family glycosyltransferase
VPALIVSYSAGPGGSERILADHASALGDGTVVACPEGWLAEAVRDQGLRHFPLRARPLELRANPPLAALRVAGHAREIGSLERNLRPDVVVAWGMRSLLACTAARLDARLVFQHVDLLPGPLVARAVRAAARRCDLVLALSRTTADELGTGTVIHPGVDLDRFSPAPPPAEPSALFLSAHVDWKRPELAAEAGRLAGVPVRFAAADGWLDDPREALREASCLIHAADREPFGLALVEALACGRPVVAPAAGGPLEIVDATCGRLYPPGDAAAAARALRAVIDDPPPGARARAERHFDLRESRRAFGEAVAAPRAARPGDGIAVVTVLHDSEPEVRALMASLDRHLPGARLVAVDSGSSDGGAEAVRDWGGTVIDAGGNVGYGRGTNLGVAAVEEEVTVIANPDVELLDSSLADLARDALAGDGILAPALVLPDGRRELSAHPEPAAAAELLTAVLPAAAFHPSRATRLRRVAWAVGACLVARTETLRRLGPFDADVFLYAEDMDLGLRAGDAGIETWFRPDARVLHRRAHSTERAFGGEAFELLARRRAWVVAERRGGRRARRDALTQAATFATRIAAKTLLGRGSAREREQLRALLRVRGRAAR